MPDTATTPTVWLTTLGCSKNQVDSDKIVAALEEAGYGDAPDPGDADIVMVNTCGFIEAARRESVETILALSEARRPGARLVVMGCMAQRYEDELIEALPEADAVLGLDRYPDLVSELDRMTKDDRPTWEPITISGVRRSALDILDAPTRRAPGTPYAYVKVAEGCNKTCSFCAIPLIRGRQRSRPDDGILAEVTNLVDQGVSEVVLVAQDLAAYGRDLGVGRASIEELVARIADAGMRRLRLYYLYPREIRPALIELMAEHETIADYFDLSLQHASPTLLRAMRRPGDGERHLDLIARIREASPTAATRSSFIVGFPGESNEDVEHLADFLRAARLSWAGFFPYSPEEGTTAIDLPGRVPDDEVAERLRYLQSIQDDVTMAENAAIVGTTLEVVVDAVDDGVPVGRSYREAPEIDGVIQLDRGRPGAWVEARIVGTYGTDLMGTVVAS